MIHHRLTVSGCACRCGSALRLIERERDRLIVCERSDVTLRFVERVSC